MHNIAKSELIERIWQALNSPRVPIHPHSGTQLARRILQQDWADLCDVSDLVWAFDGRLNLQAGEFARAFNIPTRPLFPKPQRSTRTLIGLPTMTAADAACVLINLERLGFDIDPTILTNPLGERLKKLKRVNDAELNIVWFDRERHKNAPINLVANPTSIGHRDKEFKTEKKYRVEIWRDNSGKATMLQAFAPKHRRGQGSWLTAA